MLDHIAKQGDKQPKIVELKKVYKRVKVGETKAEKAASIFRLEMISCDPNSRGSMVRSGWNTNLPNVFFYIRFLEMSTLVFIWRQGRIEMVKQKQSYLFSFKFVIRLCFRRYHVLTVNIF